MKFCFLVAKEIGIGIYEEYEKPMQKLLERNPLSIIEKTYQFLIYTAR